MISNILFPHKNMRPIQEELVKAIAGEVNKKNHLILHAPTGLGKTAASIAPTLTEALNTGKTVFFLTSKNTQHRIAIQTLSAIKERHNQEVIATDIIGKKWMCIQPGVSILSTGEFNEYCRAMREENKCEFYTKMKKGEQLTPEGKVALSDAIRTSPLSTEKSITIGKEHGVCPYELAMLSAAKSNVIVADYYYLFHPRIRENFLKKNNKALQDCIIIVDEGHNLPNRIKDLASENLTTTMVKRAISEAKKFKYEHVQTVLEKVLIMLRSLMSVGKEEEYVKREDFITQMNTIVGYNDFLKECHHVADHIREEQKVSAIGTIGDFMEGWLGSDDGFTRIISRRKGIHEDIIRLSYRCLDPSIIAKEVVSLAHSVILMSGTLTPTKMYQELLGFPQKTYTKEYPSPFPKENRLNLIVAKTSTKFTSRSENQYREIATIITDIINATPGNSAIFFPSYYMKEQVDKYLTKVEKTVFHERQNMGQAEREEMIERYKSYKKVGAALLAVVSGSFGEGIDLPGDELKTVIIVGLPLNKPDLETKALIDYYDQKFKNGWNYGYVFPAFNKIIQNAGRCIRSETDKGVVVFLDERFTWPRYYSCFPTDWKIKVSVNHYKEQVEKFFGVVPTPKASSNLNDY